MEISGRQRQFFTLFPDNKRSFFADEEKARKADARRAADEEKAEADARWAAAREKKEAEKAARRAASDEAERAERAESRAGALAAARWEANMVAEMKERYQELFHSKVVPILKKLKFNDIKISSKLNFTEHCAFVFVHFQKFHKHKFKDKIPQEEIKQILKDEMEKNKSWSNTLREKTSHNS